MKQNLQKNKTFRKKKNSFGHEILLCRCEKFHCARSGVDSVHVVSIGSTNVLFA